MIEGVVVEADAGRPTDVAEAVAPIAGAEVDLLSGRTRLRGTTTDSLGRFRLQVPVAGRYRLRVRHPTYVPYEADSVVVGNGETVSLEIRMGRNVIPLEPLVVTARIRADMTGFQARMQGAGHGTFITRADIEARGTTRTTDLLRGVAGVTIDFQRWGVSPAILMRSGLGTCEAAIFVDGVLAPQYRGSRLDDFLTPDRIEGVEIYSSFSAAPVQYISGTCGVILFWTRRGNREGGEPWHWKRVLIGAGAAIALILWIW
ncbi:MAG: carboxypeptidase regulatory-like domain-containing protein [Gemmatimonadota bacterium]